MRSARAWLEAGAARFRDISIRPQNHTGPAGASAPGHKPARMAENRVDKA